MIGVLAVAADDPSQFAPPETLVSDGNSDSPVLTPYSAYDLYSTTTSTGPAPSYLPSTGDGGANDPTNPNFKSNPNHGNGNSDGNTNNNGNSNNGGPGGGGGGGGPEASSLSSSWLSTSTSSPTGVPAAASGAISDRMGRLGFVGVVPVILLIGVCLRC